MQNHYSNSLIVDDEVQQTLLPHQEERRSGKRTKMLFKIGIVEHLNVRGFCLIKEISNEGLRIVHDLVLQRDDRVSITLGDMTVLKGRVAWCKGSHCGIRLDLPIDCSRVLMNLSMERQSAFSRALRLPTDFSAVVVSASGRKEMIVRDISQQGLKIEHDGSFREGILVRVILADGHERPAIARWSKGHFAGLMLLNPLHPHELLSLKAIRGE